MLLIANIIRIFFWLGERFELPLLCQSILLIISQLLLLSLCLHYAPHPQLSNYAPLSPLDTTHPRTEEEEEGDYLSHSGEGEIEGGQWQDRKTRPFGFWQWEGLGSYLEFLAGLILVLGILQVILGRWDWYIDALGFVALTIESTLPIPQFISNYQRKSTYGLRASTLAGWLFGDLFKTAYFFLRGNPIQFKITAIITVCWDLAVLSQRFMYGTAPPRGTPVEEENDHDEGDISDTGPLRVGDDR